MAEPRKPKNYAQRDTAPLIFYDEAPCMQIKDGVVSVTLAAGFVQPGPDGKPVLNSSVVGYLRASVQGAKSLRAALDKAILAAMPTGGEAN